MQVRKCDECAAEIRTTAVSFQLVKSQPDPSRREIGDYEADLCSAACLRDWVAAHHGVVRPDFAAAHAIRAADPLYDLEKELAADALCDAVDSGLLGDDEPADEDGPKPLDIVGLLGRKHTAARSGQLRNHGLGTPQANPTQVQL